MSDFDFDEVKKSPASRRRFLAAMSAAGLGLAASKLFAEKGNIPAPTTYKPVLQSIPASDFTGIPGASIDFQVLNFALTLEILEADIYRQALNIASGLAVTKALNSNPNVYKRNIDAGGFSSSKAANVAFVYLRDFAYVEEAHRDFLSAAITSNGGTPVTANPKGYKFPKQPKAKMDAIISAILPLEETGVRAYLGAIRSFTNYTFAQVAGTIFSTEARHSAAIRYILGQDPGPSMLKGDLSDPSKRPAENTFEYYLEPQTVLTAAKAFFA